MNIEAFMICDAATDQHGKLNVLGAFDSIFTRSLPVIYPSVAVALRMRFPLEENGDHKLEVHFLDEDGNEIIHKLEGNVHINVPASEQSVAVNLILRLQNVMFRHWGCYSINLEMDGEEKSVLPLSIRPSPH